MFRINARPGIAHRDEDAICLVLLGADRQLSRPRLDRAHCFDRVQDQVQDDLLQLNTIALQRETIRSARRVWTETPFLVIALRANTITSVDRRIEIETILSSQRFLDLVADPVDDGSRSIGVADHTVQRFPDLAQVWRLPV